MRARITNGGAQFTLSGTFTDSAPKFQGSSGYYWTNTNSSNTDRYLLYISESSVTPSSSKNRREGASIRRRVK